MTALLIWRNLSRNKRRSVITITSVAFAVVTAILLRSLQKGVFLHLIDNMVSYHTGYLQLHQNGYQEEPILENSVVISEETINSLKKLEGIRALSPRLESFMLANGPAGTKGCQLIGIDVAAEKSFTGLHNKVTSGRYLHENENGLLIAEGLAEKLSVTTGDTVILLGQGYQGSMAAGKFPVIGILHFPMPTLNSSLLYLPLKNSQELFSVEKRVTAIAISITTPENLEAVRNNVAKLSGNDFEVVTWKEMLPDIEDHFKTDTLFFYIEISILYIVIAFGLFGTLLMMIHERGYENGMLLAIGMKKRQLGNVLIGETIALGMIGALLGMAISLPIVYYLEVHPIRFYGEFARIYKQFGFEPIFPATLDPFIFLTQTLIVLGLTLLIGLYPFLHVLKSNPLQAMKNN